MKAIPNPKAREAALQAIRAEADQAEALWAAAEAEEVRGPALDPEALLWGGEVEA